MWTSADHWLTAVARTLTSPAGDTARREISIRVETVLDVAAADARAADSRTGRGVTTAHATVAATLGCSPKTVQRARTLLERLGLAITVTGGRYLTRAERAEANSLHGGDQRRVASERALLTPRQTCATSDDHLPRRGHSHNDSHCLLGVTKAEAAPRPQLQKKSHTHRQRPTLSTQHLAADLARALPWLARGHIGSLCAVLTDLNLDSTGWTAHDILTLLNNRNLDQGLYSIPERGQRQPLALLRHQLTEALTNVDETPVAARARRATAAAERRAHQARVAAAERQALAEQAHSPAAQATIAEAKATIRSLFDRRRREGRRRSRV